MKFGDFTNQLPFIADERHLRADWGFAGPGVSFRCAWCGYKFELGDTVRWVFTNGEDGRGISGNPFICVKCDGPRGEILARLRALRAEYDSRFWWFHRHAGVK